jgi:type I restriction enzyme S subunit
MSYKHIGNYIHLVDNRNKDLAVTNLLGINITKNFMPSVANTSESDLSKYKIRQFLSCVNDSPAQLLMETFL